jgi:hypothetical protein
LHPATYIEFETLENDASQGHLQGKFNNISTTDLLINPLPPRAKGPTFLLPEDKYSFAIYLYASKDKELLIKGKGPR